MKAYAIYFLQEVHCTNDKETLWSSEWGYSAIFSSFSSASAGVGILFNNNFTFKILKSFSDPEGRFQEANLELDILSLQKALEESNLSEMEKNQINNELEVKNLQREEISKYKTRGAILRSKNEMVQ